MAEARLSKRAEVDIAGIALDIAERNAVQAEALYSRIDEALELLTDFPSIGLARPGLGHDHR